MLSGAGNGCTNLLMVSNILAYCKDSYNRPNLIVGHGGQSFSPRILNNLMVNGGFELDESFGAMEFSGNELLSSGAWNNMYTVWPRDHKPTSYLFANNKYYGNPLIEVSIYVTNSATPAGAFTRLSVPGQWQGWQQLWSSYPAAGDRFLPDATSTYTAAKPTGTRVIIRPNRYDRTRANVTILNFDLKNTVDVDLSSLGLPPNTQYELHPVQNLFNQTNTGTYTGGPITVPMTGWGIRQPPGRALDLSSTFPQFGSFLFIARSSTGNTPPTVGTIPDQSINEDASTGPISFTLGDKESSPALLTLSAASSNLGLIPPENIVFGGSGGIRTVTLTPLAYQSGTAVITERPELFWGMIASMWIGNLMLVIINLPMIGMWVKLLTVPYRFLAPAILLFCCIGAYSLQNSTFHVIQVGIFGVLGYIFVRLGCEGAPFLLGLVLGPQMEEYFRRAMLLSRGDPMVFIQRPISLGLLIATAVLLILMALPSIKKAREEAFQEEEG